MDSQDTITGQVLTISVHLLDGRYHGAMDWPPSPFQLFQALVAAAWTGREANKQEKATLEWLETLPPPTILSPRALQAKRTTYYVPRNSADQCKGDMQKAVKMRDAKVSKSWLLQGEAVFQYLWDAENADRFCSSLEPLVDRFYQLGCGVDMAYAHMDVLNKQQEQHCMQSHPGVIYRADSGRGNTTRCPQAGSLKYLIKRHAAQRVRLENNTLTQAPKPSFVSVSYNSSPTWLLFDILARESGEHYYPQPACRVAALVERIRDLLAERLRALGDDLVERVIIGRNAGESDKRRRIRIVPLPSIGSVHADQAIRRVLVEVPPDCPIQADDIRWALSGLDLSADLSTGELVDEAGPLLVVTDDKKMLGNYGIVSDREGWRAWRSVTPVALTTRRPRGRKPGGSRAKHLGSVAHVVRQALRHTGFVGDVEVMRVQREPLNARGELSGHFAHGERFISQQLYHVEIIFSEPVTGPVVIGNGRYLGLGLLAPETAA